MLEVLTPVVWGVDLGMYIFNKPPRCWTNTDLISMKGEVLSGRLGCGGGQGGCRVFSLLEPQA